VRQTINRQKLAVFFFMGDFMCKKCGKPLPSSRITRSSVCEFCGRELHSCINCKFYAPGSHFDCHETVDELVKDKEKANFCDYFSPALISGAGVASSGEDKAAGARNAFAALFGN
jgi:hypothetical protein